MFPSKVLTKRQILSSFSLFKRNFAQIIIQEEVQHSLSELKPVVALESTIITHGMKFPHNFNTALEVENIIREQVSF